MPLPLRIQSSYRCHPTSLIRFLLVNITVTYHAHVVVVYMLVFLPYLHYVCYKNHNVWILVYFLYIPTSSWNVKNNIYIYYQWQCPIVVNFQNGVCQYLSKPDFSLHQHILFKDEIIECKRWNILSRVWVLLSTFKLRSEWLLLKCQLSNFSALSWGNQVNFPWDENEVGFVLDQHT
jgi:hypothetical protein